jgi:catechol 2,3-dioxygenase-like lactoylglutathione lyase family enzyme
MTRRIERAMALLRRGDLSVTEVCFAVGCSSLGTFSTRFTELVGMPPSVYKRQAREHDGGHSGVRGQAGHQTDQESRSADRAAELASATSMTAMDKISISSTFLPHTDPRSPWRSTATPWASRSATTSAAAPCAGSPSAPPGSPACPSSCIRRPWTPGITDDERRTIAEMMAKGTYATVVLASPDLDAAFATVEASGADVVQEPVDQPYGIRDCAFRDPAGNTVRINQQP